MPLSSAPARSGATARLAAVGAFGAFGLGLSVVYRTTGFGLPCPWRLITGTLCPLCGATHLGNDLLTFDVVGAWGANAYVLTWGMILAGFTLAWAAQALTGRAVRLPGILGSPRLWWTSLLVSGLIFWVVRNLV
jgi:hypothetical protein